MRVKVPPIRALARRAPISWEGFDEAFWLQNISDATWARTQQHANARKNASIDEKNDDENDDEQLEQDDDPDAADDDDALRSLAPTELQSKASFARLGHSRCAFWKPPLRPWALGFIFASLDALSRSPLARGAAGCRAFVCVSCACLTSSSVVFRRRVELIINAILSRDGSASTDEIKEHVEKVG